MNLSSISVRNPVFAWMIMAGLIVFGLMSYSRLGISQLPDVDFPVITVSATLDGAAAEIMESDIADVIEDAISGIEGIREIKSNVRYGRATVTAEMDLDRDVDAALQEIQSAVSQAVRRLPTDMDPPIVSKRNSEDRPIMWIVLTSKETGEGKVRDLMDFARYDIKARLQTVPGVGDIAMGGYVDRNLRVWLDPLKMRNLEITVKDVLQAFSTEHSEQPSGRIDLPRQEILLRTKGEATSEKQAAELPITSRGGSPVFKPITMSEIGAVKDDLDDIRRISRFNKVSAIGMGIQKQRGANAVAIGHDVFKMVDEIRKDLPVGYDLQVGFDSTKYIEESISELTFTLFLSAILTAVIIWIFLGSLSSSVNVLLAIPTSIIGSFIFINVFGFTLNTFTLLALSLAIGVVVDDAIMVLENIERHMGFIKDPKKAAEEGANQIYFAALAATLAVVAIFLPVAFMEGVIGKYFYQFGVTMSATVLLSLLEALTLTTMRASKFNSFSKITKSSKSSKTLKLGKWREKSQKIMNSVTDKYMTLLEKSLKRPGLTVIIISGFFFLTLIPLKFIKQEFLPPEDQSRLILMIKLPSGTSLEYTSDQVKLVENYLYEHSAVEKFMAAIGGLSGGESNSAMMFLTLKPPGKRPGHLEVANDFRKNLNSLSKAMRVIVMDPSTQSLSASRGFPVEFYIKGPDWASLARYSLEVESKMKDSGKFIDIDSNYQEGTEEFQILPDRVKALKYGVSISDIADAVSALIGGKVAGKFTDKGHRYDIKVKMMDEFRNRKDVLSYLWVRNNRGELVRLIDVVTVKKESSVLAITRINRSRAITITASPGNGIDEEQAIAQAEKIVSEILPNGYSMELTGQSKTSSESNTGLILALILGIIVSYMILGSQFNSFIHPFTVLLALPFSFSGAIISLLVFQQSLNLYSFIGIILLMGLVKKNSILLVEFAIHENPKDSLKGIMAAGRTRLRPILMTTFTTISAALPPALALGPGAESRIPMAVSVLGGMFFSTSMTLFLVPSVYVLLSRLKERKK
jgi:HAE1 family hydrophobic/amphiphilic exporter-1